MRTLTRAALAAAALTVACGKQDGSSGRRGHEPTVSPPLELAGLVHRIHLPYTEEANGFAGRHTTYAVAAARDGAFVVTPNAAATTSEEVVTGSASAASAAPVSARFETVAIGRGDDTVASGAGTALLADDGSLLVARGDVLERLVNGGEGIEQSWAFPAPPAGGGDVTVRVAVHGLVPAGETAGGVHFNDGTTGAGLRYGHATWIDALGATTKVPARLEGNEIVLAVPEAVVEGSLYPAILDPVISPEISLDEPVSAAPYSMVRTVTDGATSLVLWLEGTSPNCRVLGVRIGPAGELLDPAPMVIGTDAAGPLVAEYGDGVYLVAWRINSYSSTAYVRVAAATGALLDPVARVIPGASQAGSVAFDGSSFVAVLRAGSQYTAFRILSTGDIVAQLPVATMSPPPPTGGSTVISTVTVSCARQHCLAAWNETLGATCSTMGCTGGTRTLRGVLLDPGWMSRELTIATSGTAASTRPMSAANDDGFFVVWSDDSAGENDIYGSFIPFDGLRAQNRYAISTAVGPQRLPLVEHSGGRFVVLWRDGRNAVNDIYGARVTAGGTVLDPDGVLVSPSTASFGLTPAPGGVLATWANAFGVHGRPFVDGGASGLHAVREISLPGLALPEVPVATFTDSYSGYLLSWTEGNAISTARLTAAGDAEPGTLASWILPMASIDGHSKRSNGETVLLVAWEGSTVLGQLFGPWGAPIMDPFVIASGVPLYGNPRVGASGSDYLVMWTENTAARLIRAVRVAGDGVPVDPEPFVLAGGDGVDAVNPVPAAVADGWVVVYTRGTATFGPTGAADLYAVRLPARGAAATPQPLVTAAGDQLFPSLQQRDSGAPLLVWQDLRDPAGTHLRFARVRSDFSGLDGPERILTPPLGSLSTVYASSMFDGINTVVFWSRSSGFFAARIDGSDAVLDPSGVAIEPVGVTVGNGQRSTATDRAGRLLLSYRNASGEVRTRLFEDAPGTGGTLEPGPQFVIAGTKANDESVPKVASDGTSFFVVWRDTRGYPDATGIQGQVYGMRVSATGAPLDATAIALSPESSVARNPGVVFDGTSYIVGWFDTTNGTYYARRVSPLGLVLDPVPLVLATGISPYAGHSILLHVGPGGHLLTWTQSAPSPDLVTARAQWIGRDLVTLGVPFDVAPAPSYGGNGAAFLAGRWLVSYAAGVPGPGTADVHARWIGEDGTPGGSVQIAGGPGDQMAPMVVTDGGQFVVFYQDRLQVPAGQYHAARVSTAGGVLDAPGKRLFPTTFNQSHVHASWDGREWYVSWFEDRTGTGGAMATIYGARMTADLVVRDAGGIALTSEPVPVAVRNQASNGAGVTLLAYQRKDASLNVNRAVARVVTTWVPLAISATGTGTGRVLLSTGGECRGACTNAFDPGARVTLTPSADGGSVFSGWSGACSGTGACTLTLGSPAQATARFDLPDQAPTYALDLAVAGTGPGVILVDPLPGATGYAAGTVVTATAQPGTDAKFSGWTGACQGPGGCIVVMDGPKSLTALFDAGAATATALPVTVSPATASVDGGVLLTITGDRFAVGTVVTIGSATAPVQTIQSSNRLTAFSPTVPSAGPADVRIVNPDGSVLTLPSGFTFYVPGTNTPPGEDVTVTADRTYTYAPETSLKFEGITSPGATTVSAPFVAPPEPPNFAVLGGTRGPKYIEISTSATFTGKIEIAIKYNPAALGLTPEQEARMRLLHYGCSPAGLCAWEDATEVANPHDPPYTDAHPQYYGRFSPPFMNPDTKNHVIYGVTTSLSPFALADGGGTTRKIIARIWGDGSGWISGPGIDCGTGREECMATVGLSDPPQSVALAANPAAGSLFKGWSGACGGMDDCTVAMNMDRAVLARFVAARYPVTVQTWGAGTGRVDGPGGISCQTGSSAGCSALFDNTTPPQTVTLTATALGGSKFAGWAQPCVSATNSCTIEVRAATSVAARFEPDGFPIDVQVQGGGSGTVTGPGLSCRPGAAAGCSLVVPNETPARQVTLTAAPDADSTFVGWSGVCQGTATSCAFAALGPARVSAVFARKTYALTATPTGPGSGRVTGGGLDCGTGQVGTCIVEVPTETPARRVTITPFATAGSVFDSWGGACTGSGACEVTMSWAQNVIARFEPDHFPLTVQLWGNGTGTVTGPGIDCSRAPGATCQASVANTRPATTVTLTAAEAPGSVFAGWSQPCVVNGKTCTVEMSDATWVGATFEPAPPSGGGGAGAVGEVIE